MLQNKALARKLLCATMLSGMAFAAPSAFAQEEESAASEDTITVTGTRIQSANLVATSPVTTIDQFVGLKTRIVPVPLHKAIFMEPGLCGAKYAMSVLGLCSDEVRLPLIGVSDGTKDAIKSARQHACLIN